MTTTAEDIQALRRDVSEHDRHYHERDNPIISDAEYDRLKLRLHELERANPDLYDPDSPTEHIGGRPSPELAAVAHQNPMLSLANAFSQEDVFAWHARCARSLSATHFQMTAELKYDGVAISLLYRDGQLARAATRGDGKTGEDVTHTIRTIADIPHTLTTNSPGETEIRGEAYMSLDAFRELNQQRERDGLDLYANPRNGAAGAIRKQTASRKPERELRFWAYGVERQEPALDDSHRENLNAVKRMGLPVCQDHITTDSLDMIVKFYEDRLKHRADLPFEADGIVIKVDRISQRQRIGNTGHAPRWAIAWKFPAEQVTTRLKRIAISTGRFGKLTPVAELEPVIVEGVTVEYASLHNAQDIARKDIRAGDDVILQRAGGVIPQVVGPVDRDPNRSTRPFAMPESCPACDSAVRHDPEEAAHWCANPSCSARRLESLKHFVSRDAMDIEGLGHTACKHLIEAGLAQNPTDIFALTEAQLATLPRMGVKSARRIIANIQKAKQQPLQRALYSLGIYRLGRSVSEQLADTYGSIDEITGVSREQLLELEGISDKIADSALAGLRSDRAVQMIAAMRDAGMNLTKPAQEMTMNHQTAANTTGPFQGMKICVTGKLTTMSRGEAQSLIASCQGQPVGSVTKSTNVLVVGDKPGSKLAKAQQLGVTVWDEAEFYARLSQPATVEDSPAEPPPMPQPSPSSREADRSATQISMPF